MVHAWVHMVYLSGSASIYCWVIDMTECEVHTHHCSITHTHGLLNMPYTWIEK